jgi:ATP-dependent DNA helicase RecQ
VARRQLDEYNLSKEQMDILELLMRNYPGIHTDLQYIREADKADIHSLLVSLAQRGIITYIPRSIGCSVEMTQERVADVYISPSIYESRQTQFVDKIHAMVEYAEQELYCREQLLLAYFDEKNAPTCGHCDVCRARSTE